LPVSSWQKNNLKMATVFPLYPPPNMYGMISQKATLLISFASGGDLLLWWVSVLDAEQSW